MMFGSSSAAVAAREAIKGPMKAAEHTMTRAMTRRMGILLGPAVVGGKQQPWIVDTVYNVNAGRFEQERRAGRQLAPPVLGMGVCRLARVATERSVLFVPRASGMPASLRP